MFKIDMSDDEKLAHARKEWERARDYHDDRNTERRQCSLFYANTDGEGQWDEADLEYLRESGRPALTMNLIKGKIDDLTGMIEDLRLTPRAKAIGHEDATSASILNHLVDSIKTETEFDTHVQACLERGLVVGEGDLHHDVMVDPEDPSRIKMTLTSLNPVEVVWDTSSERADRKDAIVVFIDKWLSETEFLYEYPDKEKQLEEIKRMSVEDDEFGIWDAEEGESSAHYANRDRDYKDRGLARWYDKKHHRIRLIHMEYKVPKKVNYLVATGPEGMVETRELPQDTGVVKGAKDLVSTREDMEIRESWREDVYWFDFVQNEILYDDISPMPYKGFSVEPFSCFMDWEDNTAYGYVRNLIDPQREINKSYSASLDQLMVQGRPGFIAEEGAIPDERAFEESVNEGGAIAVVSNGALSGGKLIPRNPPQVPQGSYQRLEASMGLLDKIASQHTDTEKPSTHAEAAATVQLRYRRVQQQLSGPLKRYHTFLTGCAKRILETISSSMPDHQLKEYLGTERYQVQQGQIMEMEGPPGQQQPVGALSIRDMRKLKWDIELDVATENSWMRVMQVQMFTDLIQAGVPIDPQLVVEKATTSRHDRERLKSFAKEQAQSQSQSAQQESQMLQAQMQQGLQIEQLKAQADAITAKEKERHNKVTEKLDASKVLLENNQKLMAIWEKADSNEKQLIATIFSRPDGSANAGI